MGFGDRLSEFWFHEPAELYERGLVYLSEQFSHLVVVTTQVLCPQDVWRVETVAGE